MAHVSEAANRLYVISEHEPRQLAVISKPGEGLYPYGIRAHNPLGKNWRAVYELIEEPGQLAETLFLSTSGAPDLEADGYRFWFNDNPGAVLPASATRLGRD